MAGVVPLRSSLRISSSPLVGAIGVSGRCARLVAVCLRATSCRGWAQLWQQAERRGGSRRASRDHNSPPHPGPPPPLPAPVTVCGNASDGSLGGNSCALFQNSAVNVAVIGNITCLLQKRHVDLSYKNLALLWNCPGFRPRTKKNAGVGATCGIYLFAGNGFHF